ncbi:MAG TPA: hypothetical protein VGL42_09810 [Opitutaceae bacterium]|jgi:CTP synthase (UTP-ammonia lyase)
MKPRRLALIGERDLTHAAHRGIEASFALANQTGLPRLEPVWIGTAELDAARIGRFRQEFSGLWCAPGSPYANTEGALAAIAEARTAPLPFLGTCGGFQHALMEYARDVLKRDAFHQETDPEAAEPLIAKLSCSLAGGAQGRVIVTRPELFSDILGAAESVEEFNCNYGLNAKLAHLFADSDLVFVAHDEASQERAFRVLNHPFYVGTLFQPERRALHGQLHPVVAAFFQACA